MKRLKTVQAIVVHPSDFGAVMVPALMNRYDLRVYTITSVTYISLERIFCSKK